MEALSHRRAEVIDMGPVPGNFGRTRLSLTCPSRLVPSYTFSVHTYLKTKDMFLKYLECVAGIYYKCHVQYRCGTVI